MKKIALIISTYKNQNYIMDCVNSIKSQIIPTGYEIDLKIGVDGCKKTSEVLSKNNIHHYYNDKNVGAYIMRNSLIALDPAEIYSYFDGDDVMLDDYISTIVKNIESGEDLVMVRKIDVDENLKNIESYDINNSTQNGAMSFTNKVLDLLGGYKSYKISSDIDFIKRYIELFMKSVYICKESGYKRRHHFNALSKHPDTCIGSDYRDNINKIMKEELTMMRKTFSSSAIRNYINKIDMNNLKYHFRIEPEIIQLEKR